MKKSSKTQRFNLHDFLNTGGLGKKIVQYRKKQVLFSQGDQSSKIFYIQEGRVKLTVLSQNAKEAVVAILSDGDFLGEGCVAGQTLRMGTATAIAPSSILEIRKSAMMRVLRDEHAFSERFIAHILARNIRFEADLVTSFSIPAKDALPARCSCSPAMARKASPRPSFPKSARKPWLKWWNHPIASQLFHEQI